MSLAPIPGLLVALIALEHLGFLVLEMFLWQTPTGLKIFALSPEEAKLMAPLAANQGLYNGFLAAGLAWSLFAPVSMARPLGIFFLSCVIIAGIYGGISVKLSILFLQALPALIALGLLLLIGGH
jgi:putative membrane protein